jgi:1-piperideine-2-carboxylate/1-pyrroline-2-carboxylate reductase [NAD(P)H]
MMIQRYDGPSTATLLPLKLLVEELERAVVECAAAEISEAKRLEIPLVGKALNHSGPASSQEDASHKPVTMCPFDFSRDPATINDEVVVYDAVTGVSLFALDGPTVTGRRTAAITLLAISRIRKTPPKVVAIIGTGKQASTHVQALSSFYPEIELVVAGTSPGEEEQFCARHGSCCVRPFTDRD